MFAILFLSTFPNEEEFFESLLLGRREGYQDGKCYLFKEKKSIKAFEVFSKLMEQGYRGMYITRQHPDHVERKHGKIPMKIIWLSTSLGKDYVDPHNLGSLTSIVNSFVEEGKSVILLDGLEYLMINNEFSRILKFIEYVNEIIMQQRSILLISIDERAFGDRELALLERNAVIVR